MSVFVDEKHTKKMGFLGTQDWVGLEVGKVTDHEEFMRSGQDYLCT